MWRRKAHIVKVRTRAQELQWECCALVLEDTELAGALALIRRVTLQGEYAS